MSPLTEKLRKVFPLHAAMGAGLVVWVFLAAGQGVGDPDIWWHLRNAQYLFTTGHFVRADMYSFTAAGYQWFNHEWLAEIPYYLAWRALGVQGIYAMFLCLLEVMLLGIFYQAYKESGNLKAAFLVSLFVGLLAAVTFGPRTILFGYLYMLLLLALLYRFRARGRAPLWTLPILFCLWINTHGSWLLGAIVCAIFVASGLVEGTWGRVKAVRWTPQQLRQLLVSGAASFGALFINPYTYHLVYYPFDLAFKQKLNIKHVEEWAPVDFSDARGKLVIILLFGMLLLAWVGRYEWRLDEIGLGLFGLYSGLVHIRFLCLAAILLAPLLAKSLPFLPPYRPEIDKPVLNAVIVAGVLGMLAWRFPTREALEKDLYPKFPLNAIHFMQSHGVSGRLFNYYLWGGYLGWIDPNLKVFIDSRTDIFEYSGALRDYLDTIGIIKPLEVLDKHHIRYVLMPPAEPLTYLLKQRADWKIIHNDMATVLFERADPRAGQGP